MDYPDAIKQIIIERSNWHDRKSAQHYKKIQDQLPSLQASLITATNGQFVIGKSSDITKEEHTNIRRLCEELIPWRKGPFSLFGIDIDSEWRSDLKWNRIHKYIGDIENKRVLDIGCSNGYFMFLLSLQNPELVLGIDPVLHVYNQFQFLQHFAKRANLAFELLGIEHLSHFKETFDLILSMGIIYHHRNPIDQLLSIREALRPKGTIILETIGIPGEGSHALFPEDRYANMRNVWFIPTLSCFMNWVHKAKFTDIELICDSPLTNEEQRLTSWCPPPHQSLEQFLDQKNKSYTIEGYVAPHRFALKATKKN